MYIDIVSFNIQRTPAPSTDFNFLAAATVKYRQVALLPLKLLKTMYDYFIAFTFKDM